MARAFYERLKNYYKTVGAVLRGEADAGSIFPNTTDIGFSREHIYADFLRTHVPSSCNVYLGGFVFNSAGDESKQIDLLVTNDTCPRFNFLNPTGQGKSFACADGLLAAACIKSTLDSKELTNALENIASLPPKSSLDGKVPITINVPQYDEWPFKIIYASDGASPETLSHTFEKFYNSNPHIPVTGRPNLVHVAGKYHAVRIPPGGQSTLGGLALQEHTFHWVCTPDPSDSDVYALAYAIQNIQHRAVAAQHILFNYDFLLINVKFHT